MANCQVEAVDLGILNYPGNPGVRNCRIANGTADITQKPAMTKAELYRCIETGIGLAKCAKEDRVKLLVTGEMGIGNTTTSSAVASVLLGCDPLLVTGRGAGLSDSGLSRKLEAIKSDKASPPGSGRSAQCALYAWRVRYCRNGRPLPWRRAVSGSGAD